jgi:hypothetical protein
MLVLSQEAAGASSLTRLCILSQAARPGDRLRSQSISLYPLKSRGRLPFDFASTTAGCADSRDGAGLEHPSPSVRSRGVPRRAQARGWEPAQCTLM